MSRLLNAGFARLKQEKIFWFALGASLICGAAFAGISLYENTLDGTFVVPLFLVMGIFVSLSVGQEYNGSAIRNKVIVGHTKGNIFLTELLLHLSVCAAMMLLFLIPAVIGCYERLSLAPFPVLLWVLVNMLLSSIAFSVIFTVISCLIPQKALASIICILLVFAMVFGAYQLEFSLFQPKTIIIETESDSDEYLEEEIPNPRYVKGLKKTVFIAADSLIPNGQVNNHIMYLCLWTTAPDGELEQEREAYNSLDDELVRTLKEMLPYYPLYSMGLSVFLSYMGWAIFRKKELK